MNNHSVFKDMMDREVKVSFPPKRIISLVPSQTELLYHLGLEEEVVGITKFCVHPKEWHEKKTKIGGTKKLLINKIIALHPDLIIANKEENNKADIEELSKFCPVWVSDIKTLNESFTMIQKVGEIIHKQSAALSLIKEIKAGFKTLQKANKPLRIGYFIWRKPWMTVGKDTFIHDLITQLGWINVYSSTSRYPETTLEELKMLAPEVLLLSSEPYPFKEKHIAEIQLVLPEVKIILVDGEMFSWYGSRLKHSFQYFKGLQIL
jgi:ABC-type Fe3+-hydroxamate transport system substrate-binding protein